MSPSNKLSLRAPVLAAALLASACTTVGPNFKQPDAPSAAGYAMAGDAAPAGLRLSPDARVAGPWWTAFGSQRLDAVIREGLVGSPTLAEAEANLRKAQARTEVDRGDALPQADLNAGGQRQRINIQSFGIGGFPNPTLNLYSVGAAVSYDLDLFGGQKRRIEASGARAEADARRADAAYLALTGNITLQALRIAALRHQLSVLEAIVADDLRVRDMVREGIRAGGSSPSAVTGSDAQLAQDEALLPPVRRDLAAARHQMALLVGKSPAEWTAPDFDLAEFTVPAAAPLDLPSTLVRRRPDILAAEADLHAATADVGIATAALYPDIRLSAGLTQSTIEPANIFRYGSSGWNIGGGLTAPLFNGGALKANRRAAQAEADAAFARYKETVLKAFVQVSDVLTALAHDEETVAALTHAQRAAQTRLDDASAAFKLGGGPLVQVVDAQRQLSRARRSLSQAEAQRYVDLVQLYAATAADWRVAAR